MIDKKLGEEQVCVVPGSMIAKSLVCLRDVLWFCKNRRQVVAVLAVDFEKAFDRVLRYFMFKVVKSMGVPERVVGWIRCLYRGIVSRVQVNGGLTEEVCVGFWGEVRMSLVSYFVCLCN